VSDLFGRSFRLTWCGLGVGRISFNVRCSERGEEIPRGNLLRERVCLRLYMLHYLKADSLISAVLLDLPVFFEAVLLCGIRIRCLRLTC
jgi:hypothetical protein